MIDSGCSTGIIPISRLPEDAREHVMHSDILVKGINGNIYLRWTNLRHHHHRQKLSRLQGSKYTSHKCHRGQNILIFSTLNSYTINNQDSIVEFKRSLTSGHTTHTASPRTNTTTPQPHRHIQTQLCVWDSNYPFIDSWHSTIPLTRSQILVGKLRWLKWKTGLALLNHPNRDELLGVQTYFCDTSSARKTGKRVLSSSPFEYQPITNPVAKDNTQLLKF